ncbi:MAG: sugar transferase [Bacteroidia bacterium]|nr:sugar transferase [Bacteroidia bacterium]
MTGEYSHTLLWIGPDAHPLAARLAGSGYAVHAEASAFRGFLALQAGLRPGAILCMRRLPDSSAYELLERVRSLPDGSGIPFFAVADTWTREDKRKALAAGADDILSPASEAQAFGVRLRFLQQHRSAWALPAPPSAQAREVPAGKRLFDLAAAGLGLLLASPLLLAAAALVRLHSPGPVLEVSKRVGRGYQIFDFYKLRTRRPGPEGGASPIGRWLQRSSLDDLPQLLNVLKGDMSIVGNRPLALREAEQLTTDQWSARFLAPAGITGPWQIARRRQPGLTKEDRRRLEVAYAREAGPGTDLRLLWETICVLFKLPAASGR